MCISDGSSDVGSSDLGRYRGDVAARQLGAGSALYPSRREGSEAQAAVPGADPAAGALHPDRPLCQCLRQGPDRTVEARMVADRQDRDEARRRRAQMGNRLALLCDAPVPRILDAYARQGAVRRRSEEHTSELQSLMRISYAVFCLKNKKKPTEATSEKNRNT